MTYRVPIFADVIADGHRRYTALRKGRQRCAICRHHHGASRNHAPEKCRAHNCGCRHMLDWFWPDPPWSSGAAPPTLPLRQGRYKDAPRQAPPKQAR